MNFLKNFIKEVDGLCNIIGGFSNPGQYDLSSQSNVGFCGDWILGPIGSSKVPFFFNFIYDDDNF